MVGAGESNTSGLRKGIDDCTRTGPLVRLRLPISFDDSDEAIGVDEADNEGIYLLFDEHGAGRRVAALADQKTTLRRVLPAHGGPQGSCPFHSLVPF
jgi:hypothetical protein